MSAPYYEVIVGNVGTVYAGASQPDALEAASAYIARSKANDGRAAGEPVTVLRDGELFHEYTPAAAPYHCKNCGAVQRGADCDEMTCDGCGCCDWTPITDKAVQS